MQKENTKHVQDMEIGKNVILEGERDIMEFVRMQKIADMLSKVVEGKDFTIKADEGEYLREALKSTDKCVGVVGNYLNESEEEMDAREADMLVHGKSANIVVASTRDRAMVKPEKGVQYIWVKE
ncbi:hypothetical protein CN495_08680 [Bacillus thuringiensis]|uniref:Uncharacterized protein n=1 Tax=Bacillus thuringiensis TaxID=1428 RepID=A0ABD6SF58_BACTU|nr:hypothetical protein [Bacillus thuringiensis]PER55816.1 hypothetical protein CN495_08680 [Bacillus thuringiensis]